MRTRATPPARAEWDFSFLDSIQADPPPGLLFLCHVYEFSREIPFLREEVAKARKQGRGLGGHGVFSGLYKIKQWPEAPFRAIKSESPRREQAAMPKPFKEWADSRLAAIIDPDTKKSQTPRKTIQLAIPETYNHEQLKTCFAAYLRCNFPSQGKRGKGPRNAGVGAGSPIRQIKADLKALGAYRLLLKMTANKASEYTETELGEPLFKSEKSWSEAKRRAKRRIEFYIKEANGFPF